MNKRRSAHPWGSYAEYQVWRARDAMHLPPEPPPNYQCCGTHMTTSSSGISCLTCGRAILHVALTRSYDDDNAIQFLYARPDCL